MREKISNNVTSKAPLSLGRLVFENKWATALWHLATPLREIYSLLTGGYKVYSAVTPEEELIAYRIRHEVYCEELNYEPLSFAGFEKDPFDENATQVILYSKKDGRHIGCTRFIHGDRLHPELPFEKLCGETLDQTILKQVKSSGDKYAEISRLAVVSDHRRGVAKKSSVALWMLYLGILALARHHGIKYLFALVQPRLFRVLQIRGIPIRQIGKGVDHRGLRVPVIVDMERIEPVVPILCRPVYAAIKKDIEKHIADNMQNENKKMPRKVWLGRVLPAYAAPHDSKPKHLQYAETAKNQNWQEISNHIDVV